MNRDEIKMLYPEEVQENLPIIIENNTPPPKKRGKWRDLIYKLEVGDSVVLETSDQYRGLRNAAVSSNREVTSRREEGGIRVWRIK